MRVTKIYMKIQEKKAKEKPASDWTVTPLLAVSLFLRLLRQVCDRVEWFVLYILPWEMDVLVSFFSTACSDTQTICALPSCFSKNTCGAELAKVS